MVTLVQIRDVIAQLPNLDNLELSGFLVAVSRRDLPGIGTVARGRFGGRLMLSGHYAHKDTINMLLEVPSGLRFTEVVDPLPTRGPFLGHKAHRSVSRDPREVDAIDHV